MIEDGNGGFLCITTDRDSFSDAISTLCGNTSLCAKMSEFNKAKIKEFDTSVVETEIRDIYAEVLRKKKDESVAFASK